MTAGRNPGQAARLRDLLDDEARKAGFDVLGVATAEAAPEMAERLRDFIANGRHGTMQWMAETAERRARPRALWSEVRSVIILGMNYGPDEDPLDLLERRDRAAISVYARHRDYHDVIKGRLKTIAQKFAARAQEDVKVFVDTAPVMEKPLAESAGLGWQGKHTNLVSRDFGSWLFLGSIFTTAELEPDAPETDHCGSCRACLDICPTDAFPSPYQLDARRCISYLTIEHKGPIPSEFRTAMGNRIYGCDDCLAVCPWNKFASQARETRLQARTDLKEPGIAELLELDDPAFRALFSGSPVKRIGRDRFIRNVLIAAGNSGETSLVPRCLDHLADPAALVRGAAVWALSRLMDHQSFAHLAATEMPAENDPSVMAEWRAAQVETDQ
jgi:epoxyqueuosine reductase